MTKKVIKGGNVIKGPWVNKKEIKISDIDGLEVIENLKFAEQIGINTERVYRDFDEFIELESAKPLQERMEAVSVLTPNFLHYPMAKKLLENGFNVICEKPLTTSLSEAKELQALQKKNNAIFAVTYTYTGYPMVREMKNMIAIGVIGEIHKVDLQYYQQLNVFF